MMKLLNRYIARTIILTTLFIMFIFSGLLLFFAMLAELKNIGEGDYQLWQIIIYVLLSLPNQLYQFFPLVMLLGSVIGLNLLSSRKELLMMRASGFSLIQISSCVVTVAFFLVLITVSVGETYAPKLNYLAEIKKENAKNAGQAVVTSSGVWLHVDNNFIHVRTIINRHRLQNVVRYEFDENDQLRAVYLAKELVLHNQVWYINQLIKTTFQQDKITSETLASAKWDLTLNPNLFNAGLIEPQAMALNKLYKFIHYLKQNNLQAAEYEFEFWQRIFRPLASVIMILLAIPFVLGSLKDGLGWRIMLALISGFIFFILNALLGQLCIVFQISAFYAALFPLVFFLIIGILLMRRLTMRPSN